MNVTDLADAVATRSILDALGRDIPLVDAHALAEDALDFDEPPAGAWTLLAHVAEHRCDYAGLEQWTAAALDVDPAFGPSCDDDEYLWLLREPSPRKAIATVRADHLFEKLDHFSGRIPQLRSQLDLAELVLGIELPAPTAAALDVADTMPFLGFLAFDAGMLAAFESQCGPLLPPAERALLSSWRDVRHRHVRMVEQARRRWRLVDVDTGEVLVAHTLFDERWPPGAEAFVLVVPVGAKLVVVGEPVVIGPEHHEAARAAMADGPLAVARTALGWLVDGDRAERMRFLFPDLDPAAVPNDELAIYELVCSRRPDATEAEQLIEAIVAERIITRRVLHTWDMAKALLAMGGTRDSVLAAVTQSTYAELWDRANGEAA